MKSHSEKILETSFLAHSCTFPGCGSAIVMDGNMKNRRDVCYAKDAGYIQFDGLEGSIKTGCTATPTFKSRYCTKHINQACTAVSSVERDEELGETTEQLRSKLAPGDTVAEMLLAKKETRKQTYNI